MSDRDGLHLDDIEQRLAARTGRVPHAGHRDRVLAAVRDTLAGRTVPRATPHGLDAGGTAVVAALALSALLAIVAPWVVVTQAVTLVPPEPRIVAQARAAGIELPVAAVAATSGPLQERPSRTGADDVFNARRVEAWRPRNLLTGDL